MDVDFEGSGDGCDSRKVEVPGRSWRGAMVTRRCCEEVEEHRQLLERVRERIHHCCVVADIVAAAEAAGSCHSAEERDPWRGIGGRTGGRTTAIAEVVQAVVCCDS